MRYLCLLLVCAGCSTTPEQSMAAALPARAELQLAVPENSSDGGGTTAMLYEVTRKTSAQMNGTVGSVLELIGHITSHPATVASADGAEWGPFTPPLSPATYRLIVHRVAPDAVEYHLDGRPHDSTDDGAFQTMVAGAAHDATDARSGQFSVDATVAHALDPVANPGPGGGVQAGYQLGASTSVRLQLGDGTVAGAYRYDQLPDGSGDFQFATHSNLVGDPATLEDGIVRSRWLGSGAGRGDAHVRNGDATTPIDISQCWDTNFQLTPVCAFPDAVFADL